MESSGEASLGSSGGSSEESSVESSEESSGESSEGSSVGSSGGSSIKSSTKSNGKIKNNNMSVFGTWQCPICKNSWTGSIGWDFTICSDPERLEHVLEGLCGCTNKPIQDEQWKSLAFSLSRFALKDDKNDSSD